MKERKNWKLATFISLSIMTNTPTSLAQEQTESPGAVESSVRTTGKIVKKTGEGFGEAALSPLEDLNLKREHIPEEFNTFQTPYDSVDPLTCKQIATEVRILDTLLDVDIDVQLEILRQKVEEDGEETGDNEKLSNQGSNLALGAIASEARSIIPFRSIVRQATGAKAHQKRVDAAYEKAFLRRAFLKGLGLGMDCTYPAAPLPIESVPEEQPKAKIIYRGSTPDDE